ncbi:MAG: ComEC/Rec2 family competence protein [Acetatifactor sp.]|nr:ComEC/Rec2 family competence protein [Acetatifactor sp.]
MRRPLFWVALFLIIIAAVRLETGEPGTVPEGVVNGRSLGICQELTVTGQVYKKDNQNLYLQDIIVCFQASTESEDSFHTDISQAGVSRQNIPCQDNIICKLDEAEEIPLGSYVTLRGSFSPVSPATNPGEFDSAAYYRTMGVGGRLSQVVLLARGQEYWLVREWLYNLRIYLEERLYRALPEDRAGVLCALLLGDKGGLDDHVKDLYRQSGILHILSISSLHITILGMSFYRLLRRLRVPVGPSALAGSILLLLYGGLVGFGVSACRAIGMYLIRMLGEVLGRTYDMLTALAVMGALMVWQNPYYLHHSGFLLSYASVLGVGVLSPALSERKRPVSVDDGTGRNVRNFLGSIRDKLRQSAFASLSVVLTTLPVQLWYYYEVPVYSVFMNLLVLPLVKPLMFTGFLAMLFPELALPQAAADGILRWYQWLCELCGGIPFHTWNPGCPQLWQIGVYYLLLGAVVIVRKKLWELIQSRGEKKDGIRKRKDGIRKSDGMGKSGKQDHSMPGFQYLWLLQKTFCDAALICSVLLLGFRSPTENRVTFLDVGQGDCILVQTRSGENYLFDCGSTSRTGVGEYVLLPFLKYNGIQELDAVLVSHSDKDHVNGILELFEIGRENGIEVRQLILPDLGKGDAEQMEEFVRTVQKNDYDGAVDIRYIAAGDTWECDGARFICLNPEADRYYGDVNAGSQCFFVEFIGRKNGEASGTLLLTGDVEGEGEITLLEQIKRWDICQVDVLKVAHHGSRGTTSEELLEQINPKLSVISCGRKNFYGHPHPELMDRLERSGSAILQTRERGAVTICFEEAGIFAETFLTVESPL